MAEYKIDLEDIKQRYAHNKIGWVRESGVFLDEVGERYVRMKLPLADLHINHVGIAYAGSIFMLGEVSTAAIIYSAYGTDKYIPIASRIEIDYLKPSTTDLVLEYSMTEEERDTLIAPILERGKGKIALEYFITNEEGEQVAKMKAVVYLMPAGQQLKK
ncbi:PaaI family thioesterase [Christensenellaceae bacterium OttesenSCG-928-K19]|nr:PaaI family thioesterase [Christensenellaceae bacterium OttesenSCG-928-K19]